MVKINSNLIEQAVYNLCVSANTKYCAQLYGLILQKYNNAETSELRLKYARILENIKLAADSNRPLCQDTGQVIVFVKVGHEVFIEGQMISVAINNAVEKAYKENFYRKSVVKNALFNRNNTQTNTPAIVYTEIVEGNEITLDLMVKGAGSENYSAVKMFKPSASKEDIFEFVKDCVTVAGEKSCPPLVLGIGIGGTMDYAAMLSKKAFFHTHSSEEAAFASDLMEFLSAQTADVLDVSILSASTHIACLPVAVTINCHSCRHSSCVIKDNGIVYTDCTCDYREINPDTDNCVEVNVSDVSAVRSLSAGRNVLLTGEIFTARDAAHKRIKEYYEANHALPFDLKDKIIFYAGPCPAAAGEVIGPVGPTTSARMDDFCEFMHSNGLLASIGKGERSIKARNAIKKYNAKYFIAQGGVACLLSKCVEKSEVVAFEELGTEAVRKLYVEKLPVKVVY